MPTPHPRPWHRGSLFGPGPRRPLDREQRARFRFLINVHHRAGRLSRAARDVAEALVRRLGVDGQCDPAHSTLADDAGCSDRTVRRALDALRGLGLVAWVRRLVRTGWRVAQTSNSYLLALTENPAPIPVKSTGGQKVRQIHSEVIQKATQVVTAREPAEIAAAQAALAARRAVIEARLLGKATL
ncbi:MAG TPA: helix-turn-helix domain-containing protein [Rhodopila sp.]|nr:helix-turn-helix domain-containing protein [Rhodopila sp.]